MSASIGSLVDNSFLEEPSTNFEIAAIQTLVDETKTIGYNVAPTNLWIVNSAYACSPLPPNVQVLNQIKITSTKSLSSGGVDYKEGENLETLFKIIYNGEEFSIDEFIERSSNYWMFTYDDLGVFFQLASKPDLSINQKFTFIFTFNDELEYQILTDEFIVD